IRDIPMVDSLYLLLEQHKSKQNDHRLMMGNAWKPKKGMEDLVFTTETGYPINRDVLKQELNRIIARINDAGIKFEHITPHCTRHSFSTRCIERGMPYKTLQLILGHSKLSMTMDIYAHVLPCTKANDMQCVDGLA
ncbi:MAG TPA: tyrosine-type recombinase/integrase, partial [Mobilitalea sp.]|nr:tyrosine-type recombinase/integrase [Mobilitalea sp.]